MKKENYMEPETKVRLLFVDTNFARSTFSGNQIEEPDEKDGESNGWIWS